MEGVVNVSPEGELWEGEGCQRALKGETPGRGKEGVVLVSPSGGFRGIAIERPRGWL
jgi:hypothetical protein